MADRRTLERLWRAHEDLREDFRALVKCVEDFGAVREPWLHAVRFRRTCERYPLGRGGRSLADVLEPGLLRAVLQCSDGEREQILAFKEACPACRAMVEAIQAEKLYVFGGWDAWHGNTLGVAEKFSPCSNSWEALPDMRAPRMGSIASVLSGRVYLLGGFGASGQTIECFNPRLQQWETRRPAPRLSTPRLCAAAVPLDGELYICGGEEATEGVAGSTVLRSTEVFRPALSCCELLPVAMLAPRTALAAARLPWEGRWLFVCGGQGVPGGPSLAFDTAEALCLCESGAAWERLPAMNTPREGHAAVALGGSIFVCGGHDGIAHACSNVERFDGESGSWSPLPSMSILRDGLCVASLCGSLCVFGGQSGGLTLSSGERFDHSRQAWEPMQDMMQGRTYFGAAVVKVGALAERRPSRAQAGHGEGPEGSDPVVLAAGALRE